MASANLEFAIKKPTLKLETPPAPREWMLANPWLWLVAGLVFTFWSALWTFQFHDASSDLRILVLGFGLLLVGVGLWIRWRQTQIAYLPHGGAVLARFGLACFFAIIALGTLSLFVSTFFIGPRFGLNSGPSFMVLLTCGPLSILAARRCFKAKAESMPIRIETEMGLSFILAGAACFLGSFTLYLPELETDWDTFRLALRVFSVLCLYGAALALLCTMWRRMILSLLFVIHFMAITTACLSAPPSPWIVTQAWLRLFRPYLEFAYLNNAYHFYAPEPGPTSYLWFRLIYTNPDKQEVGWWFKVPKLDERGRMQHTVALEYQRFLALTESIAANDSLPPVFVQDPMGNWVMPDLYRNRLSLLPQAVGVIGMPDKTSTYFHIPMHPAIPQMQQVMNPNEGSRRLLASYARFAAHKFAIHPEQPELKFKSVKIYRVIHWIPQMAWFQNNIPSTDPELYRAYFMGNYDAQGKLIPEETMVHDGKKIDLYDPYLYWLLPILRDNPYDPASSIKDYARLHAGDPNWVRPRGSKEWEPHPAPRR